MDFFPLGNRRIFYFYFYFLFLLSESKAEHIPHVQKPILKSKVTDAIQKTNSQVCILNPRLSHRAQLLSRSHMAKAEMITL